MRLGPHLHRIGNDIVAAYLIDTDDGVTLVDAGLAGHFPELTSELTGLGRSLTDIRGVILTHGDTDHIGFAARLSAEKGIAAYLHEDDAPRARLEVKKPNSGWGPVKARPLAGFLWYSARHGGLRIPPATGLQPVKDGEVLDVPGAPRIIHTPGHTPGSVTVHVPAVDAVFLGDTFTTRNVLTGATGPKPAPFTLEPGQAIASLDKLGDVDATWVLPGHGPAWDGGAPEAVRLIRESAAA